MTEEQRALADALRGLATHAGLRADAIAIGDATEADALPATWQAIAAQDVLALPFDGTLLDVCVAVEALAHELVPGPVVPTLIAAVLVHRHAEQAVKDRVEAGLRDGSFSASVALGGLLLGGTAPTHALVPVEGRWTLAATGSLATTSYAGFDPTRRTASFDASDAEGDALPGLSDDEVRRTAAVLLSAEASGLATWCLDTAVDYAKVREQFGQPIGSFQAVKHRCAAMLAQVETARAAVWDAAEALDGVGGDPVAGDGASQELAVAVAAATALDAAVDAAKDCIQVLGGIGFTWEHDAHRYLKRALASRQLLGGTTAWHIEAGRLASQGVRRVRSLELGSDGDAIRSEVRTFLATLDGLDDRERRMAIADAGYLVPHWPAPYGRDAGPVEQLVIDEEFRAAGVARPDLVIGNWALPTILQYGTDEQRKRFVPPTLHGEIRWCQMFSEPGAGSDLASLQTKAIRVDGGWTLSGQKVWTSTARTADWAICLARTSADGPRKQDGITYFLVDMHSPGLDVRPLREITGEALFNEIFINDVFVPDDCVVGEVGGGWRLARTTLANERVAMSSGSAFPSGVEELLDALSRSADPDDPVAMTRVGELVCLAQADAMLGVRSILARVSGTDPGAASSIRKLVGMHLRQDAAELALDLLGPDAVTAQGAAAGALRRFLANRSLTIAGGTSEILHNVVGERILGLPR